MGDGVDLAEARDEVLGVGFGGAFAAGFGAGFVVGFAAGFATGLGEALVEDLGVGFGAAFAVFLAVGFGGGEGLEEARGGVLEDARDEVLDVGRDAALAGAGFLVSLAGARVTRFGSSFLAACFFAAAEGAAFTGFFGGALRA